MDTIFCCRRSFIPWQSWRSKAQMGKKKGKTTQLILVHELSEVSVDFYGEETGTIDVVAKV